MLLRTLLVIAVAALAWRWYATRDTTASPAGDADAVTIQGTAYRIVGQPNAAGQVPVQRVAATGMLGHAMVELYDPATGQLVRQGLV